MIFALTEYDLHLRPWRLRIGLAWECSGTRCAQVSGKRRHWWARKGGNGELMQAVSHVGDKGLRRVSVPTTFPHL